MYDFKWLSSKILFWQQFAPLTCEAPLTPLSLRKGPSRSKSLLFSAPRMPFLISRLDIFQAYVGIDLCGGKICMPQKLF